ncbi:MAG TPA: DUF3667 domain-containing protein [Chitinophagaceae bacterium]|jgi:hypothetical protein|nr:DUF3667 domain-containing protein [Chitinophagaceae bacterium]
METNDRFQIVKKCPACGKMSVGNYCVHCGEKLEHGRYTFQQFLKSIPEVILDNGFGIFYTIYELIIHPGQMVKSYFSGNRKKHYKPVNFFLFIGGLVAVLFISFHISAPDANLYEGWVNDKELGAQLDKINNEYLTGILLLQFPIIAFFTWLFFRRKEHFFGEHLVANAYFIGEVELIRLLLFPIYLLNNKTDLVNTLDLVNAGLILCYYIYAFYDWLYNKKTWSGFFIIVVFVVILYIIVMMLTMILIVPGLYLFSQLMSSIFS